MVETYTPSLMQLTDGAVQKILALKKDEINETILNRRVYVTGGGCSGFQYGFKFDSPEGDDDTVNFDGFTILLDSLSYPYLYGSTLDYVEDLSGSRFLVTNPNAKTTCGCGESFTI